MPGPISTNSNSFEKKNKRVRDIWPKQSNIAPSAEAKSQNSFMDSAKSQNSFMDSLRNYGQESSGGSSLASGSVVGSVGRLYSTGISPELTAMVKAEERKVLESDQEQFDRVASDLRFNKEFLTKEQEEEKIKILQSEAKRIANERVRIALLKAQGIYQEPPPVVPEPIPEPQVVTVDLRHENTKAQQHSEEEKSELPKWATNLFAFGDSPNISLDDKSVTLHKHIVQNVPFTTSTKVIQQPNTIARTGKHWFYEYRQSVDGILDVFLLKHRKNQQKRHYVFIHQHEFQRQKHEIMLKELLTKTKRVPSWKPEIVLKSLPVAQKVEKVVAEKHVEKSSTIEIQTDVIVPKSVTVKESQTNNQVATIQVQTKNVRIAPDVEFHSTPMQTMQTMQTENQIVVESKAKQIQTELLKTESKQVQVVDNIVQKSESKTMQTDRVTFARNVESFSMSKLAVTDFFGIQQQSTSMQTDEKIVAATHVQTDSPIVKKSATAEIQTVEPVKNVGMEKSIQTSVEAKNVGMEKSIQTTTVEAKNVGMEKSIQTTVEANAVFCQTLEIEPVEKSTAFTQSDETKCYSKEIQVEQNRESRSSQCLGPDVEGRSVQTMDVNVSDHSIQTDTAGSTSMHVQTIDYSPTLTWSPLVVESFTPSRIFDSRSIQTDNVSIKGFGMRSMGKEETPISKSIQTLSWSAESRSIQTDAPVIIKKLTQGIQTDTQLATLDFMGLYWWSKLHIQKQIQLRSSAIVKPHLPPRPVLETIQLEKAYLIKLASERIARLEAQQTVRNTMELQQKGIKMLTHLRLIWWSRVHIEKQVQKKMAYIHSLALCRERVYGWTKCHILKQKHMAKQQVQEKVSIKKMNRNASIRSLGDQEMMKLQLIQLDKSLCRERILWWSKLHVQNQKAQILSYRLGESIRKSQEKATLEMRERQVAGAALSQYANSMAASSTSNNVLQNERIRAVKQAQLQKVAHDKLMRFTFLHIRKQKSKQEQYADLVQRSRVVHHKKMFLVLQQVVKRVLQRERDAKRVSDQRIAFGRAEAERIELEKAKIAALKAKRNSYQTRSSSPPTTIMEEETVSKTAMTPLPTLLDAVKTKESIAFEQAQSETAVATERLRIAAETIEIERQALMQAKERLARERMEIEESRSSSSSTTTRIRRPSAFHISNLFFEEEQENLKSAARYEKSLLEKERYIVYVLGIFFSLVLTWDTIRRYFGWHFY